MTWLVTFDVPDDRQRRAITTLLRRHGLRVAFSVFVVHCAAAAMSRLLTVLDDLVRPGGHLLAVPFCDRCQHVIVGSPLESLPEHGWVT